jgi:hypothetical protein
VEVRQQQQYWKNNIYQSPVPKQHHQNRQKEGKEEEPGINGN